MWKNSGNGKTITKHFYHEKHEPHEKENQIHGQDAKVHFPGCPLVDFEFNGFLIRGGVTKATPPPSQRLEESGGTRLQGFQLFPI
jgi:hypothetical protein